MHTGGLVFRKPLTVAEFERTLIREWQREGIALTKQRGVYRGRHRSLQPDQIEEVRK